VRVGVFVVGFFGFWFVDISYKGMDGREEERSVYTKFGKNTFEV
jgi:hypothetical protein